MAYQASNRKQIEHAAFSLVTGNNITAPSVDVEAIAKSIGLDIIAYDLGDSVSGALVIENGKGFIGYNPNHSKTRRRFTISHEIAHYQLHNNKKNEQLFVDKDFIVKYRSHNSYNTAELKQEQEANAFAAELLMPRKFILAELEKDNYAGLQEPELIEELAKLFEVSIPAMTFRLSNINALPW